MTPNRTQNEAPDPQSMRKSESLQEGFAYLATYATAFLIVLFVLTGVTLLLRYFGS